MKNKWLTDIVFALIAAALAFIAVPAFMISQTPEDFYFLDFQTFISSALLFTILFGSVLSLAIVVLHWLRLRKVASSFSLFVMAWIVTAGFILPVSSSTGGMVEPQLNPYNYFNFSIVAIISVGLSALASTVLRKPIVIFLSFIILAILGSILYSLISIYGNLNKPSENNDYFALSNKRNIIVVSFDGLPGEFVANILKNSNNFSSTFKDFKVFDNAVSQSPATKASLMGEVYGVQDYKSLGKEQLDVLQTLEKTQNKYLLTSLVKDSFLYGEQYPPSIAKTMRLHPLIDNYQQKNETFDFFRYPIVRLATSKALRFSNWSKNVEHLKTYVIGAPKSISLAAKLKNHVGPWWDRNEIADILNYDFWVEHLSVSDKEFSIRYLHFTFTHFPVDFDATCAYKSDDITWHQNHQNEGGIRLEVNCALDKFSNFLNKLKSLNIYDQSLIVFKSDHGKPANYFSNYPNNLIINSQGQGTEEWGFGYNRYRPTLMIKDFGANNVEIVYDNNLVLLNDMAKTLCVNSGLTIQCDYFHGNNLLSRELENDGPYYIYVPKNSASTHHFDTHVSVKIPSRKIALVKAMEASSEISLSVH